MKTIKQVQEDIDNIFFDIKEASSIAGKYKRQNTLARLHTKLEYFLSCKRYLDTEPSELFLSSESARITNRINLLLLDKVFADKKKKAEFEKEMGIPKLRHHLSTITYLQSK